jgi:acyl dehydratase
VIDRSFIGFRTEPFVAEVEKGRLRMFAKAIGETDPVYFDEAAAQAAGFRSLPVPLTFLFCLEMERPDPYDWFDRLGIPVARALHGEQSFEYHRGAFAGDVLAFESEITDIYDKRGGALEFVVQNNAIVNQGGESVATFERTVVIRHG